MGIVQLVEGCFRAVDLGSTPNSHWLHKRKRMTKKKTVGAIASELQQKTPETRDPIEIQREVHKDYIDNLKIAVDRGLLTMKHDFYVTVIVKKEKLLENVLRNYFAERSTCPTPDHDQSVYKYHYDSGNLEYLWTIPDIQTCEVFLRNVHLIVPEEQLLLEFVLNFYNGELMRLCRKLNGENIETGIVLEGK